MAQLTTDHAAQVTVLIIDRRSVNRAALRMVLETEPGVDVVGEAGTLTEALSLTDDVRPHVIILDLDVVSPGAASAIRQIVARCSACVVMLMALFVDPVTQAELMTAGAAVCVEKDLPENLLRAFRDVRQRSSM